VRRPQTAPQVVPSPGVTPHTAGQPRAPIPQAIRPREKGRKQTSPTAPPPDVAGTADGPNRTSRPLCWSPPALQHNRTHHHQTARLLVPPPPPKPPCRVSQWRHKISANDGRALRHHDRQARHLVGNTAAERAPPAIIKHNPHLPLRARTLRPARRTPPGDAESSEEAGSLEGRAVECPQVPAPLLPSGSYSVP